MAEVKRTRPGQSFLNKPIGVVNITTGAGREYEAKAAALDSVSGALFDLTRTIQVKEGQKFAEKYKTRDAENNLVYENVPFTLGSAGRAVAEQEINKKYLLGLKQDAYAAALELRQTAVDDVDFSTQYSEWIKKRALLVEGDAGKELASQFSNNSQALMVEHASGIKSEKFAAEQRLTASQYELDLRETMAHMYQAQLAGDTEEANITRSLIEQSLDEDAVQSFKLSREKRTDLVNALNDNYRNSSFQKMIEGASLGDIVRVEGDIDSGVLSKETKAKFPELQDLIDEYASSGVRIRTFNTFVSGIRQSMTLQQAAFKAEESVKIKLASGGLTNTPNDRKDFSTHLGYSSPLDAIEPQFAESHFIENNSHTPSEALYELAGMAKRNTLRPAQRMAFGQRLVDIDASASLTGGDVSTFFGGALGDDMQRELELFKAITPLGNDEMLRYYEQENDFNSPDVKAKMAKNAGYLVADIISKSANDIAEYYIENSEVVVGLPANARAQLLPQVKFFLNHDGQIDTDQRIKNYVEKQYGLSEFYEASAINPKYSRYINKPEKYIKNPDDFKVFKARVNTLGDAGAKTYLQPIAGSDISATYVAYQIGPDGAKNPVTVGGKIVQLNTANFVKAREIDNKARTNNLLLMREKALSE